MVLGFFSAKSALKAQTFSGWSFQMSWVLMAVKPMPSATVLAFQGSPTQKPSISPERMLVNMLAGGVLLRPAFLSGFMPPAASPLRTPMALVPVGDVMAKGMGL